MKRSSAADGDDRSLHSVQRGEERLFVLPKQSIPPRAIQLTDGATVMLLKLSVGIDPRRADALGKVGFAAAFKPDKN
jgi:hypothetical protein